MLLNNGILQDLKKKVNLFYAFYCTKKRNTGFTDVQRSLERGVIYINIYTNG